MKIVNAIKSGSFRLVNVWKGVLIIWFFSILFASLLSLPMKGALKSGFGKSMITDKLMDGIDIEVISDLGPYLEGMASSLSSVFLIFMIIGIMMNAFLKGGLFDCLKGTSEKFSGIGFFMASAKNFWSFLVISLIISFILLVLIFIVIGIPFSIVSQPNTIPESLPFIIKIVSISLFMLLTAVLLLVADYARAWQVTNETQGCFKALSFGFNKTFSEFQSSFPFMIVILFVQIFFALLVSKIRISWTPVKGAGVFLLFLISQFMLYIRFMLKAWRYASVTSLMEQNNLRISSEKITVQVEKENQSLNLKAERISIIDDLG